MSKPCIFILSFLLLVLASCDETANKQQAIVDNRPKKQLQLIKAFNDADSAYKYQDNEITKKEILDSSKAKLAAFILKDLNAKVENWSAIFEELEVSQLGDNLITVSLLVPLAKEIDKKLPESDAILLYATVTFNDKQIKDQLKTLSPFDSVVVSGTFEKDILDNIDISASDFDDRYTFSAPKLLFKITSIKKQ